MKWIHLTCWPSLRQRGDKKPLATVKISSTAQAGAWIDRHGRRHAAMIAADLGRFGLLVTLPIAYALGLLTLGRLYAVAFGTGILSVLSLVGSALLLRDIWVHEPPPADKDHGALAAGARFIAQSPIVRPCSCAAATINFFTFAFIAIFLLYAVRTSDGRACSGASCSPPR